MKYILPLMLLLCACSSPDQEIKNTRITKVDSCFVFNESDFNNAKVVYKVKDIPGSVKDILKKIEGGFDKMADAGGDWESGDAISDMNLPRRTLVCFIDMGCRDILLYEQGGIGTYYQCYLFLKNDSNKVKVYSVGISFKDDSYDKLENFFVRNDTIPASCKEITY